MFTKEKKEIRFRAIIEILGRPKEFLVDTLNKAIENLEKEENIKVLHKEVFEPKEIEEQKDLFTDFAEAELSAAGLETLFEFIAKYAPSNIEIISPSDLNLPANEANMVLNGFIARMHKVDHANKMLIMENNILKKRLGSMTPEEIQELDRARDKAVRKEIEEMQKQNAPQKKPAKKQKKKK